jgi:hypothetical protein
MQPELLFEITILVGDTHSITAAPDGDRTIAYIAGGKFEGPRLKGDVLPGGGDWFLLRPDGVGCLDVRLLMRTDDGELIYMTYCGRAEMPQQRGLPLKLRTAPTFAASTAGKYAWINSIQAVAEGETIKGGVIYKVYRA